MEEAKNKFKISAIFLVVLNFAVWGFLYVSQRPRNLEFYFLDVGQGDSSLIMLPRSTGSWQAASVNSGQAPQTGQAGRVKVLIDGGPPTSAGERNLEKIFLPNDRYIDLVIISHPQLDHFGGLINIFKDYRVGAVVTNGQVGNQAAWRELERIIKEKNIKQIAVGAGDRINYNNFHFNVLSPMTADLTKKINDTSLVLLLDSEDFRAFFGGDITAKKERQLANLYNVNVDLLKVSHHGSKYSSDGMFLKKVSPSIAIIEVGKNSYSHPTKEALGRLKAVDSSVFRTDKDGLVRVEVAHGKLNVYTER